ncbi:hypothetical protein [Clostridium perfringens]|uniref:hypothetical protein n=1 Tax=Clostridium perfringens TaxID=1502 RepID=UPI0023403717|nr:hypothetical protein [Clostridium perfringens]
MINMNVWNESYNKDWLEMKQDLQEDEMILLMPVKVKFDKNGVIISNRSGSTLDNYKEEIEKEKHNERLYLHE